MTQKTTLKELLFWLIFVCVGAYVALWLVDLGYKSYTEPNELIFTKTTLE